MASFQEARGNSYWLVGIIVSHLDIRAWQASYTAKRVVYGDFQADCKINADCVITSILSYNCELAEVA